jgi:hypothetical protein
MATDAMRDLTLTHCNDGGVIMKLFFVIPLLLCAALLRAQPSGDLEHPLTLRTCEGDVVISGQCMLFRGYKLYAERVRADDTIELRSRDGAVTALLDLKADENIFLIIREGSLRMVVKSCVREILLGDHPAVAGFLDTAERCREARNILRQGLLAVNM